jgi:hypothetical protein
MSYTPELRYIWLRRISGFVRFREGKSSELAKLWALGCMERRASIHTSQASQGLTHMSRVAGVARIALTGSAGNLQQPQSHTMNDLMTFEWLGTYCTAGC